MTGIDDLHEIMGEPSWYAGKRRRRLEWPTISVIIIVTMALVSLVVFLV